MKTKITQELLERYHQGKCSDAEKLVIEDWLQQTTEDDFDFPADLDMQLMEDRHWDELSARIHPEARSKKLSRAWITRIAACITIMLGLAVYKYQPAGNNPKVNTTAVNYREIVSPRGRKSTCTLPDGTIVQLNADSRLKYPEKFSDTSRVVEFEGEAFFTVAKDKKRPFSIHSKQTVVRVLGTHFNLRAYRGENTADVVVEEGRVMFSAEGRKESLILTANQQGIYQADHSLLKKEVYAAGHYAWRENRLQFSDEKLSDIAVILERWYNVKLIIKNPALKNDRYTGKFNNPALINVLNSLGFGIGFKYHIKADTVTIY